MELQSKKLTYTLTDKLQLLSVLYISIWAISPPLAYGTLYRVVAVAATGMWVWIELLKRPGTFFRPTFATLCSIVFIAYSALVGYWVDGPQDIVRNFHVYIFLMFLIIHESYQKRDIKQLRIVFWTALILYPIWLGITLNAYSTVSNVSRLLTRSTGIESEYTDQGIGGFSLIYSVLVSIPILLYLAKNRIGQFPGKKFYLEWLFKGLVVINLLLGCLVIVKAGYSISMILLTGSIIITLLIGNFNSLHAIRLIAIILTILVFSPLFFTPITEFIEDQSRGTMYERKVQDVKELLTEKESVGTVSDRSERYLRSVNLFLEHPLTGTLTFADIGKHSAILDKFAQYGLIVGAIFAYTVFYLPLRYIKKLENNALGMTLAVSFVVISFSCLNNIFSSFGFIVFIFYPVAITYCENR